MDVTHLVVGLGNPGPAYADHRHNVGYRVVDELAVRRRLVFRGAGTWDEAVDTGRGVVLLKPRTYMNRSGEAVAAWWRSAAPDPESAPEPLVVCDDLALPLGSLRLRARGSSGGQKGLASILAHLGGEDVPRLRLGIAPLAGGIDPADWADFVLEPFAADERRAARDLVARAADAVEDWLEAGTEAAAGRHNRRVRRAEPEG